MTGSLQLQMIATATTSKLFSLLRSSVYLTFGINVCSQKDHTVTW